MDCDYDASFSFRYIWQSCLCYVAIILMLIKLVFISRVKRWWINTETCRVNNSINQSKPVTPRRRCMGYPDRCLRSDGSPSTPVLCNAEQWWHRLARPLLDVVLPRFKQSTSATPSVHACSMIFGSVSWRQTCPNHDNLTTTQRFSTEFAFITWEATTATVHNSSADKIVWRSRIPKLCLEQIGQLQL